MEKPVAENKKRSVSMDIIRCFALLFVVSVHFFLNNGFYDVPVYGARMYIMTLMRSFFMICVPLFMILSGYLMCNKKLSKGYYKKIIYILGIYFGASICCVMYSVIFLKETRTFFGLIDGFLGYYNAPYAWYVEMYIGLFLLCPFLNLIYTNLSTKKEKQILLITFIVLTALPYLLNASKINVLPDFFVKIYPITYYFIGCYLREYKLKLSSLKIAILSLIMFFANGSLNYFISRDKLFLSGGWQEYGSVLILIQSVLLFAFFDNLNYEKFPLVLSKILKRVSGICYGAYLVSWIFDQCFYKILNNAVTDVHLRLNYFPIIVPAVYICSLILSFIIELIYRGIEKGFCLLFVNNKKHN